VITYAQVVKLAKTYPQVEETSSWGNPSLKVKGKLLAVLKDEETLVLRVPMEMKDFLLGANPELFWTTPHYDGYAAVLIRLKKLKMAELKDLMQRSYEFQTRPKPKARVKAKAR
jgi:hypothetical protein